MEKHAYYERVLTFALDFGKKLLESGYEVTKSQDTMERLCKHYGDLETNFFVIPQEINATVKFEEDTYISQMREINGSSINLFMIEKLNALSRKICKENIELDKAKQMFQEIILMKPYSTIFNAIGSGLGTGGFAVFFGGTLLDGFWSFLIGFMTFYLSSKLSKQFSTVAVSFLMSLINGLIVVAVYSLGLCHNPDMVMIGSIMTMIPGMSFGNSVKDLLIGNTISGILTIINAMLISVAIASGLAIPMVMFLKDYITSTNVVEINNIVLLISALIGSLGFGLLFSLDQKKLWIISVGGLLTTLVLIIGENFIQETVRFNIMFANMIASGFALMVCEILARKLKAPTAIFLLPFLIPLVPG